MEIRDEIERFVNSLQRPIDQRVILRFVSMKHRVSKGKVKAILMDLESQDRVLCIRKEFGDAYYAPKRSSSMDLE